MHTHQPRAERPYTPSERQTIPYRTWKENENAGTRILIKDFLGGTKEPSEDGRLPSHLLLVNHCHV